MRRIGYRRLLPLIQTVLYGALLFAGYRELRELNAGVRSGLISAAFQEFSAVPFRPVVHLESTLPVRIGICINLPAFAVSAPFSAAVARRWPGIRGEILLYELTVFPVAILWWLVGGWIDRRTGYIGTRRRSNAFAWPALALSVALFAGGILAFGTAVMYVLRGYALGFRFCDRISSLVWTGFFFCVMLANRLRAVASSQPASISSR